MSSLFTPYTFDSGLKVRNRLFVPPMTIGSSLQNGAVTSEELDFYRHHSKGVGIYVTPATSISPFGKGFEGQPSAAEDRFIPGLTRMAQAIQGHGTKAILQLFHAGRMTNSITLRGGQPVSASSIAAPRPGAEVPRELTSQEILETIDDFAQATRRAIQAGFDGIELHGANTYLLQQFFSPHSNRRTDDWGGSIEKRMAFPLAVIVTVQKVIAEVATKPFVLGYRISPEELEEPGIRLEDTLVLVDRLAEVGLDYLHISLGDVWHTSKIDRSYKEPIIKQIQKQVAGRLPLFIVGGIEDPEKAKEVRQEGFDFVGIGKAIIRDPQWAEKTATGKANSIRKSISQEQMLAEGINPAIQDLLDLLHFDTRTKD